MKETRGREKVAVIGLGYVGLPLACAIAKSGKYDVYGIDVQKEKIENIQKKISPIEDKQAAEDLKHVTLHATTDTSVLREAKYVIICVPTPVAEDKRPDLTPIIKASESVMKQLQRGQMIILESTVNPGVCEEVVLPILEKTGLSGGVDFELAHCPERINPGSDEWNVYNIPRNVGALTPEGTKRAAAFYRSFLSGSINEVSSIKVAEATKIVENTFRDINIAFVNELAQCFDKLEIDTVEVIRGAANKPFAFLPHYPGCGVGGHCIPVDPYYLIEKAYSVGFDTKLMRTAREINNGMPEYTAQKLVEGLRMMGVEPEGAIVGLLGMAYKANIGDCRESPSFEIKKHLEELGMIVLPYDPYVPEYSEKDLSEVLGRTSGVVIATNHKEFLSVDDWRKVRVIIDGRNCLDTRKLDTTKIYYEGVGRGMAFYAEESEPSWTAVEEKS